MTVTRTSLFVALAGSVLAAVSAVHDRAGAGTSDAATFRVATFNIHKGADRQGRYDLRRTIEAIARLDADLVGVQEALRNDAGFGCDDQPALIADGLARLTGRPWTYHYVEAWVTTNRQCHTERRGDDVATEGLAVFAPERIFGARSVRLSAGRVALAVRVGSMRRVPVILTHLSPNRESQPQRVQEIAALLPWAEKHGAGILMGDLNATPQATELAPVLGRYVDAWADAAARGLAAGVASGSTRPGRRISRIDYVLYAPEADLTLESAAVIDTSAPSGPDEVSDHRPVVATFRRTRPVPR